LYNHVKRKTLALALSLAAITGVFWKTFCKTTERIEPVVSPRPSASSQTAPRHSERERKPSILQKREAVTTFEFFSDELLSRQGLLQPDEARALLRRVETELTSLTDRSIMSAKILHSLCLSGHSDQAWEMLDPGFGLIRDRQISMIMSCRDLPVSQRLEMLRSLEINDDKMNGVRGIFSSSSPEDLLNLDYESIRTLVDSPQTIVGPSIARSLNMMYDTEYSGGKAISDSLLQKSIQLLESGLIDSHQLTEIFNSDSFSSPFQHWNLLDALGDRDGLLETRKSVTSDMIREDPHRAMQFLMLNHTSNTQPSMAVEAIASWLDQDSRKANEWIVENLSSIPPQQKDDLVGSIITYALKKNEVEVARMWISNIGSPEKRAILEKMFPVDSEVKSGAR
jgi:hypothetical protein